jgi:hypothetical protein
MSLKAGQKGRVIDRLFIDGQWMYKVRFEDGTEAWVPEKKLKKAG